MKLKSLYMTLAALPLVTSSCRDSHEQVDLIVHHAQVYTVDSSFSKQEAFAVKDGKILAVGDSESILEKYTSATTIDVEGKPIYPGFYDAHCHFFGLARNFSQVDLLGVQSPEEIIERIQAFREAYPDLEWIVGHGWDQNLWQEKKFPDKKLLDKAFPDVPVYLTRIDWHAALANESAFRQANVDPNQSVSGGLIEKSNGLPTGILVDNAMRLVGNSIPEPSHEQMTALLKQAEDACFAVGLTTIADAGLAPEQIELLDSLYKEKQLSIRDYAMVKLTDENLPQYLKKGPYTSEHLDVRSFKIVGDGALGSRGACLLTHYSDAPNSIGFLLTEPEKLEKIIAEVAKSDFQLNIHAIGDSTNRIILDLFGRHKANIQDKRWRIEHAQIVDEKDFAKFQEYAVIPSIQPTHATSDMFWALDRIGAERLKNAYAYRRLLEQLGLVAFGSDFPVEHINPLYGFHAAVARVNAEGKPTGGFQMENALSREEALKGMTIWAAYSCFQEDTRGSIEAGKFADFVILDQDIMTVADTELRGIKVLQTFLNGSSVFSAKSLPSKTLKDN